MPLWLRTIVWSALLFGWMSAGPARAQPAHSSNSPEGVAAAELAEEGRKAHDLDHLDEAIDKYGRAYFISGDPNLLFDMAEAHREAGHAGDALRLFQSYLRRAPRGPHGDSATQQINELERQGKAREEHQTPPPSQLPPPLPAQVPALVSASGPQMGGPTSAANAPGAVLTAPSEPSSSNHAPPVPRWIPWATALATVALATGAIVSGLSASSHFDALKNGCGATPAACDEASISDVKSRAGRANILWVLTGVAALGTGITVYINSSAAARSGGW